MSRLFKISRAIALTSVGTVGALMLAETAGLRLNFTDSAPSGLWMLKKTGSIERGSLISFCPPDSLPVRRMSELRALTYGTCPNTNVAPLLKAVGAVSGDLVKLQDGMPVSVNGSALPNTISKNRSITWPDGTYTVKPGQVWVFSTYNPKSFDSRYFGPVDVINIIGQTEPVFIDGSPDDMKRGIPDA